MAAVRRPTVRDIARHAGVSVATVSRVTSDDPRVRAETRARVQASIDAHGYTPSSLGLGLARRRHQALGVVLPGLGGPYFAELLRGVESVAAAHDTAVTVLGAHLRPDVAGAVERLARRTDALVVQAGTVDDAVLAAVADEVAVVVLAGSPQHPTTVRTDGESACRDVTAHLVDVHGHRRLRFVGLPPGAPEPAQRHRGFRRALSERGLVESGPPLSVGLEAVDGAAAARDLRASGDVPDALVCANDEIAFGLLATLPGLGYDVPHDVAIVGFDDNALAALAAPRLTTVHQPTAELGATAARLALAAASGEEEPTTDHVLPTRTVVRESCGCSPAPGARR
ncbi:LacI family DNA-binding transcriptional regulator [Isoptericola sp. AK164]|uniref:LacI family DNA-binding transcriptional regulator n=1 Tax=Isoptericola sp. AK164 TaxID=3024246 RepID=UPI0024187C95|nr:LacI family DNA-binding transcriptional regulator [Isoptericola sp. AK164]